MKSFSPQLGAIAFGESGVGYPLFRIDGDRLVLNTPKGLIRVPAHSVVRWEPPTTSRNLNRPVTADDLEGVQLLFCLPDATPEIVNSLIRTAFPHPRHKRIVWDSLTREQQAWLKQQLHSGPQGVSGRVHFLARAPNKAGD